MTTLSPRTEVRHAGLSAWATRLRRALPTALSSIAAVAIALVVGALILLVSGDDAIVAYRALFAGAFGGVRPVAETLVAATPLILGGLAFAVAARAGLFNIGIEGQLVLGGLAAGLVGALTLGVPRAIHLPLALVAAALAGGVWGAVPGILKARTGAHEVITTIMLNYLAFRLSTVVISADDQLAIVNPALQATEPALPSARLPGLVTDTRLHAGLLLALAAAVVLWYGMFRTSWGYRLRTVGLSRGAAAYAGISWGRTIAVAMLVSGLLGGLAGASETLGLQGRYYNVSAGYGFTAIAVGLVGRNHPFGVILAGLLFGALSSGATRMQNTAGTSKEIVQVLQALVILAIAALAAFDHLGPRWRRLTRARAATGEQAVDADTDGERAPGSRPPAL